ncbi:MAG TPA: DUF72 domain-containing protein [Allosphingosinicella sp.]|jgi:uncharacterized protein YecE (DUF72 family)|nr:DUF72 domain-containing protein [Allosphingosinicella sp.]
MSQPNLRIGTAGWTIPASAAAAFPGEGSSLERYSARLACAEINSSFHRSHRPDTWRRWASSVPEGFLFSAKLSKEITHKRKLAEFDAPLAAAVAEMKELGERLALLLVQLPPSLAFEPAAAESFLTGLRALWDRDVALEPRHPSWFEPGPDALLADRRIARVAADPARVPAAAEPGGWRGLAYYRLHGSPVMYRSSYDDGRLEDLARRLAGAAAPAWCIFDNTASSAATGDALKLDRLMSRSL